MKHRIVHTLQKYLLNPPIRLALARGRPQPGYALLKTKGRKTGKPRRTPVGDGHVGNQFWLVAEHGMKAGYVRNIERDPHVRLKLREGLRYRWHRAPHISCRTMIRVNVNGGSRNSCHAAREMRGRCASSARNSSVFELIWTVDPQASPCGDFLSSLFHRKPSFHPALFTVRIVRHVLVTHRRQFTGSVFAGVSIIVRAVGDDLRFLLGNNCGASSLMRSGGMFNAPGMCASR